MSPRTTQSEARLQMGPDNRSACMRLGPAGFNTARHDAWYGAGTVFFVEHTIDGRPVSVAEVHGFAIRPQLKQLLIPGSDGLMDQHDIRALATALATTPVELAWFEKERTVSHQATKVYIELAKYRRPL